MSNESIRTLVFAIFHERDIHQRNLFKTTKGTGNLKIKSEKFENDSPIMY